MPHLDFGSLLDRGWLRRTLAAARSTCKGWFHVCAAPAAAFSFYTPWRFFSMESRYVIEVTIGPCFYGYGKKPEEHTLLLCKGGLSGPGLTCTDTIKEAMVLDATAAAIQFPVIRDNLLMRTQVKSIELRKITWLYAKVLLPFRLRRKRARRCSKLQDYINHLERQKRSEKLIRRKAALLQPSIASGF